MNTWLQRACVTAGSITAIGLLTAVPATAHVTANSPGATQGGYAVVTFRVPTESKTATTTGLTVTLPKVAAGDKALSSVRTTPLPGWTAAVAKDPATGAPTAVTWTAQPGTSLGPDQFGQFPVSVGPLPKTDTVRFSAEQTYSDGSTVKWDQPPKSDGSEPEHPACTVTLAAEEAAPKAGATALSATVTPAGDGAAADGAATDSTARWLAGAGLLLGALGLGLGAGAAWRARSRP